MGATGLGRRVEFVPQPVTTGFTAGIGVVIATLQAKDLLGLSVGSLPETYLGRARALLRALPSARWEDALVASVTLGLLLLWPRLSRKVPSPLVALGAAALL